MIRWIAVTTAAALAFALALPASAKKEMAPAGKAPAAAATGQTSVTGPVKGAVNGKTFVIARKGGQVTVDASKAKVRQAGKFVKLDTIKGGSMVTAKGTTSATTLSPADITEFPAKKPMKMTPTQSTPTKGTLKGK